MRILLIAVGTRMPEWVETAYRDYAARLPHECRLELIEIAPAQRGKNADLLRAKQQEGEKILKALPRDALVIALDEHGRQHTSVEWAGELKQWMQSGRDTCLLIGDPYPTPAAARSLCAGIGAGCDTQRHDRRGCRGADPGQRCHATLSRRWTRSPSLR